MHFLARPRDLPWRNRFTHSALQGVSQGVRLQATVNHLSSAEWILIYFGDVTSVPLVRTEIARLLSLLIVPLVLPVLAVVLLHRRQRVQGTWVSNSA